MKGLLRSCLALLSLVCVNAFAALSGPSSSTGNYTLTWTDTGKRTCYSIDRNYAYELKESVNGGGYSTIQITSDSTQSYSFTNKSPGTYRYYLRARKCSYSYTERYYWSDTSEITVTVTEAAPTSAPSLSGASSSTGGTVYINWNSVSGASTYKLEERNVSSGSNWSIKQNTSSRTYGVSNKSTARYEYRVSACNSGGCSAYSPLKTLRFVNPPGSISSITFPTTTWYGSTPNTSWASVSGESYYKFKVRNTSSSYWFYDTQLTPNGTSTESHSLSLSYGSYYFNVQACKNFESVESCSTAKQSAAVTVIPAPGTPGTFSTPSTVGGNFSISWGASSGSPTGYTLQRSINGGSYTTIGNGYTSRSYSQTSVAVGTYRYRVRGYRSSTSNYSSWRYSNTITAAKPVAPGTPSGPDADDDGGFTISWSAVSNATSYRLEQRKDTGSFTQVYSGSGTTDPQSGLGTGVYDYRVQACNALGCGGFSGIREVDVARAPAMPSFNSIPSSHGAPTLNVSWGSVSGANYHYNFDYSSDGGSTWNDTTNTTSTSRDVPTANQGSYRFRVQACSKADSNTTCSGYRTSGTVNVVGVPGNPSFDSVNTSIHDPFTISWTAPSGTSYVNLQEQNVGSSTWFAPTSGSTVYDHFDGETGSYHDTSPVVGHQAYRIRACNSYGGCSGWVGTPPIYGQNVAGAPTLTEPSAENYTGSYAVTWSSVNYAGSYTVEERKNGGSWVVVGSNILSSTQSVLLSDRASGNYDYRVKACNYFGCGSYSSNRSVYVTVAPQPPAKIEIGYTPAAVENGSVQVLVWASPSDVDSYELEYLNDQQNWQPENVDNLVVYNAGGSVEDFWFNYFTAATQYRVRSCSSIDGLDLCSDWLYSKVIPKYKTPTLRSGEGTYNLKAPAIGDSRGYVVTWEPLEGVNTNNYLLVETEYPPGTSESFTRVLAHNASSFEFGSTETSFFVQFPQPDYEYSYAVCAISPDTGDCVTVNGIPNYMESLPYRVKVVGGLDVDTNLGTTVGSLPYSTNVDRKGSATVSVPITVPPGTHGIQPSLSLEYNSGSHTNRNEKVRTKSLFDNGWNLTGFSEIYRCKKGELDDLHRGAVTATERLENEDGSQSDDDIAFRIEDKEPGYAPRRSRPWINYREPGHSSGKVSFGFYEKEDHLCLDDQLLILVSGEHLKVGAIYRTKEESFKEIEIKSHLEEWGTATRSIWFEVRQPDGRVAKYGDNETARIRMSHDGLNEYFKWAITEIRNEDNWPMHFYYRKLSNIETDDAIFKSEAEQESWYPVYMGSDGRRRWYQYNSNLRQKNNNETNLRFVPHTITYPGGTVHLDFTSSATNVAISTMGMYSGEDTTRTYRINNKNEIGSIYLGINGQELPPLEFDYELVNGYGNRLSVITDGIGKTTTFTYQKDEALCNDRYANEWNAEPFENSSAFVENVWYPYDFWDADQNGHYHTYCRFQRADLEGYDVVVTNLSREDENGEKQSFSYAYGDEGLHSDLGYGFLGKGMRRVVNDQTNVATYTAYKLQPPLTGKVEYEVQYPEIYTGNQTPLYEKYYTYRVHNFSAPDGEGINRSFFRTIQYPEVQTIRTYNYDYVDGVLTFVGGSSVGNSTQIIEHSDDGNTYLGIKESTVQATIVYGSEIQRGATIKDAPVVSDSDIISRAVVETTFKNYCEHCPQGSANTNDWRLNLVDTITTTQYNGAPGSSGVDVKTQTTTQSYWEDTSKLQSVTKFPGDPEYWLTTSFSYNYDGNLSSISIIGANVSPRTTTFDGYYKGPTPAYTYNAYGHVTTAAGYDYRFNSPTISFDSNGEMSSVVFDNFKRIVRSTDIYGNTTNVHYYDCSMVEIDCGLQELSGTAIGYIKVTDPDGDFAPRVEEYFDQFDRPVLVRTEGFNPGEFVSLHTVYNDLGLVQKQSHPYNYFSEANYREYEYDNLGRKTREFRPDGSETAWIYGAVYSDGEILRRTLSVDTVLEPDGTFLKTRAKYSLINAAGKLVNSTDGIVSTTDYRNNYTSFDVSSSDLSQAVTTRFEYDALGNVNKAIVDGGSDGTTETSIVYDNAGNRRSMTGQNVGTVEFEYSALGELIWTRDSAQNVTEHRYDKLGRPTSKITEEQTFNYYYDENFFGSLDSVTNNAGYTETYSYGHSNNPYAPSNVVEDITVDGRLYHNETDITYDERGRAATQGYGQQTNEGYGLTVGYQHNHRGDLVRITDTATQQTLHEVTHVGLFGVERVELGNGGVIEYGYSDVTGFNEGISHSRQTSGGSESPFFVQNYRWDSSGNLSSREFSRNGINGFTSETFEYDNHDRITVADIESSSDTRTLTYQYSNLGNLMEKWSDQALDAQVTDYAYGGIAQGCSTAAGPHAVTSAEINGHVASLCYDANGYITEYQLENENKFIEYNNFGQPISIRVEDASDDSLIASDEFKYGPKGNRYFKRSQWEEAGQLYVRTTLYFSDGSERTYVDTKEGKDYQYLNKVAISGNIYYIQEMDHLDLEMGGKLEYLHHDHLGSVIAVTTENLPNSSVPAQENAFDPFGSRRSKDWLSEISTTDLSFILDNPETTTNRGFTGHEHLDRTGFIHMNGRVYDPVLGRFLTPDPLVQAPTLSQSWNRYSYVWNNPMRMTDPSGYSARGTGGGATSAAERAQRFWNSFGLKNDGFSEEDDETADIEGDEDDTGDVGEDELKDDVNVDVTPYLSEKSQALLAGIVEGEKTEIKASVTYNSGQTVVMTADNKVLLYDSSGKLVVTSENIDSMYKQNLMASVMGALMGRFSTPKRFKNTRPQDEIGAPLEVKLTTLKTGKLNYVVLESGQLKFGRPRNDTVGGGHIDLANGKPVLAAGEVLLIRGKVKWLNNASGHYMPKGKSAEKQAVEAFERNGFDAAGKYIEVY